MENPLRIDMTQPSAKLYLYSNRMWGTQVLRPYCYGFDERSTNFLLGKGDTLNDAIQRKDVLNTSEVANIIKPDAAGIPLDMSGFNALWTFVLVITIPNNYKSGILAAEGSKTLVFKGHCGDEPLDPNSAWMSTPIINRNCPLIVHSREILRDNPTQINAFGMRDTIDVCGITDVIDGSLNQCSDNRELFMLTPSDVLENFTVRGTDCASTPAMCSITNDRKPIQAGLKNPGLHLKQILQGVDATEAETTCMEMAPHGIDSFAGAMSPAADISQFKQCVVNQLSMMNGPASMEQGIEIRNIVTIGDVERTYPNLVVIPQQISSTPEMEILPQDIPTKRSVYSSFAASAISSIAAGCGLSSISFQYQSYDPMRADDLDKSSFQVVSENAMLTCPPSNPALYRDTLVATVKLFRAKFQNDLVPFIKYVCGEFFIQATYLNNGETVVNLQFLDDTASTNGGGWFETPNRLSSVSSTSVGNIDNFNNNGHSLNAFVAQIQGKTQKNALGLAAFDRPGIDFGNGGAPNNQLAGAFGMM